ncbi:MAG: hypothetical protein U5N85_01595 [Arcicella sp.]|nr:hypothetical protein [Arcicella sp.]
MKKLSLIICLLTIVSIAASAQQEFAWDHYKVSMTLHNDFKVTKNTDEEFRAKGDGMEVYMDVWEENIAIDDMDEAVAAYALKLKMTQIDAAHKVNVNGLDGFYVEGFKDGDRVMLAGLIVPNSHTNLIVEINFDDKDTTAEKDALEILNSIKKTK